MFPLETRRFERLSSARTLLACVFSLRANYCLPFVDIWIDPLRSTSKVVTILWVYVVVVLGVRSKIIT